jgi:hypothetical protein
MGNNVILLLVIIGLVIMILSAAYLVYFFPNTMATTTVPNNNLTTMTVTSLVTTVVTNLTTATGPNLASCNGYESSMPSPYYRVIGSCNWRGGLMNVSLSGGSLSGVTLDLVQLNVTNAPFNSSYAADPCSTRSGIFYIPLGNYQVSLTTGASFLGTCGNATVRLTKS